MVGIIPRLSVVKTDDMGCDKYWCTLYMAILMAVLNAWRTGEVRIVSTKWGLDSPATSEYYRHRELQGAGDRVSSRLRMPKNTLRPKLVST